MVFQLGGVLGVLIVVFVWVMYYSVSHTLYGCDIRNKGKTKHHESLFRPSDTTYPVASNDFTVSGLNAANDAQEVGRRLVASRVADT